MKVMITSFGIEHSLSTAEIQDSIFHQMPPVSVSRINKAFMPDYELLVLCDSMIMDEASFDRLVTGCEPAYAHVAETFRALKSEGRIELRDFSAILRPLSELLERMVENDLRLLDQWVEPLRESLTIWQRFWNMSVDLMLSDREKWLSQAPSRVRALTFSAHQDPILHEDVHTIRNERTQISLTSTLIKDALESSAKRKRKEYRDALRNVLQSYLTYVDVNLILSHQLDVGFHDWLDFTPFYSAKFLSVGQDGDPVREGRNQIEKLFTVSFPELAIRNTRALMKTLNDRRLEDLRRLVADAINGRVQFDIEFAKSVLSEVFHSSQHAKKLRSIVGYATLPIGLIPWVGTIAQKGIEEGIGIAIERKHEQKHRWFYMLSDIAQSTEDAAEQVVGPNRG
jgi:hypothetical protein